MFKIPCFIIFLLILSTAFAAQSQGDKFSPAQIKEKTDSSEKSLIITDIRNTESYNRKSVDEAVSVTARFVDGGRLFENECYLIFKTQKGPKLRFTVTFPDKKIEKFNFLIDKKGKLLPNKKMKNKKFYIRYIVKEIEDENTGELVKRCFIDFIELKK